MRLWVAALGASVAGAMALLGLLPSAWVLPLVRAALPDALQSDKALHAAGFAALAAAFYWTWEFASVRATALLSVLVMSAAAVASEVLQGLLPYRGFDEMDILANMAGISAALPVCVVLDLAIRRFWGRRHTASARWTRVPNADDEEPDIELGHGRSRISN
ncbi:hypothetical protein HK405_001771 [Cladochytrium tenue]|nr:hypothetical protein HK405_001771 [Cladochytrium tenue]